MKSENCLGKEIRKRKTEELQQKLNEFSDLKSIPQIKTGRKKVLIAQVKNKDGKNIFDMPGIANIFAGFYEELYKSRTVEEYTQSGSRELLPEFTMV